MHRLIFVACFAASPAFAEPTGYFGVGAGYNPDDGFLATAELGQPDLFHSGQQLVLHSDVGMNRADGTIAWTVPAGDLALTTELFAHDRDYPGFRREQLGGDVKLAQRLDRHTKIWARYQVEHVAIDTDTAARTTTEPLRTGDGVLATVAAGLDYSTLDTPFLPQHGTKLSIFAERADRALGSDYDLDHAGGSFVHARPLGALTLRISGRADYIGSRDGRAVPLAFREMYDGHLEVRGYGLDQGTHTGDNLEADGRVELEVPVWKRAGLSVAGWFDAGYRRDFDFANTSLLQRSAGVSLIWRSPLGPLRFDWAVPLDGHDRHGQFLFSLGGYF
jgi:outer membrane protein insertion porin family